MINVDAGVVKMQGSKEDIMSDLSTFVSEIKEILTKIESFSKDKAQEKILLAVERGFLITEKMDAETAYEMYKLNEKINER